MRNDIGQFKWVNYSFTGVFYLKFKKKYVQNYKLN